MISINSASDIEILAVSINEPERIFPQDLSDTESTFRNLAKRWHPDRNTIDTSAVMAHITALHQAAVIKIKAGTWTKPGTRVFHCTDGKKRSIRYRTVHPFELGEMLVGENLLLHTVENNSADLFHNAMKEIKRLDYPTQKIEKAISLSMPNPISIFETDTHSVFAQKKKPDVFCLRDVLKAMGGKLDPRHVAWIINRVYNIACFFEYCELTHNDISLDSVFISPEKHTAMLLGGWWYALPLGARISALPIRSVNLVPYDMTMSTVKKVDHRLDLALVKMLGRELLGDPTGMLLSADKNIPKPMAEFLRQPSTQSAKHDYEIWEGKVLPACFGVRRFVKLALTSSDIYSK